MLTGATPLPNITKDKGKLVSATYVIYATTARTNALTKSSTLPATSLPLKLLYISEVTTSKNTTLATQIVIAQ